MQLPIVKGIVGANYDLNVLLRCPRLYKLAQPLQLGAMLVDQINLVLQVGVAQLHFEHELVLLHELVDFVQDAWQSLLAWVPYHAHEHLEEGQLAQSFEEGSKWLLFKTFAFSHFEGQ